MDQIKAINKLEEEINPYILSDFVNNYTFNNSFSINYDQIDFEEGFSSVSLKF